MDDLVKQAMAKWPNVPHCYGWLHLDARGAWRMRDERAQAMNLPGDKINHSALLEFIHRNYTHDDLGQWYFQNGPQRVYVDLEVMPFIARTDPLHGLILHTNAPFSEIDTVWITERGEFIFQSMDKAAMLDDRDLAQCIEYLRVDNSAPTEERLLLEIARSDNYEGLTWHCGGRQYQVRRILHEQLPLHFNFIQRPRGA